MDTADGDAPEQSLRLYRTRLAVVGQITTDAIIVIDDDGRIRMFNAAAERLFGCSEQGASGSPFHRFIPPRLRGRYRAAIDHWAHANPQGGYVATRSTCRGLRTDGQTFPCEVSVARCLVGGTQELLLSVRDISERKQLAKAASRHVAFERFLFELSRAFIAIPEGSINANMTDGLARVGTFLDMDRVTLLELSHDGSTMTVAYSWSHDEVPKPPPVLTSHDQPWWLSQVLRGAVSLASRVDDLPDEATAEKEYLRRRGVLSAASIPLTVSGQIAGAISFVTMRRQVSWTPGLVNQLRAVGDILWNALKRRQAATALLAARESARESEDRFRLIANTAPVLIWMSDVDKRVTYVNQRWLEFTGWPPNVQPGYRWTELIHPEDVEGCRAVYLRAFDQRQRFQVEHRLRRHDGEYRWAVTVGVPRYETDSAFAGYVGTSVDVTDRKLVELALLQSHAALQERTLELEQRTTQLSRMASDVTLAEQRAREELARTLHDGLQQLLVSAALNVEHHMIHGAHRDSRSDELVQAKHHLDEAIAAARSLSVELFPPVLHTAGLPAALGWLADWSRTKYGLEVTISADPRANPDRRDVRTLLFQSVRELLFNVVKHAHVDRVTVELVVSPDNTLCISVTDEGVGFNPITLDEQTKDSQAGWGLFSIRERLTLLGGRFDIDSVPGQGTRFRLFAPRDVEPGLVGATFPLSDATVALSTRQAERDAPRALRILIADDHDALRKAFRALLQARPEFQVVGEAVNGREAIAQAYALRPHVILMDVSMPEIDGVEATRRICSELPFIQILGFSIHTKSNGPHAIERAGAKGFFTKGIDTQRLIDHLLVEHASFAAI